MLYAYGSKPYKAAVVHGGPGAIRSVALLAQELGGYFGTLEPIQSKYRICELIDELHSQILSVQAAPITLVGHSWGAMLVMLYAAAHPAHTRQIVLVGAPPLDPKYAPQIMERRMRRLSGAQSSAFRLLLESIQKDTSSKEKLLKKIGEIIEITDNYEPVKNCSRHVKLDGKMYADIWSEAEKMRTEFEFIRQIKNLKCPVTVIHGENDPHPVEGVLEPLSNHGIQAGLYLLKKCGHSPFIERFAADRFYEILREII